MLTRLVLVAAVLCLAPLASARADETAAPAAPRVLRQSPSGRQTLLAYASPVNENNSMAYWLYEPAPAADANAGDKLPTVIFLHGAGERSSKGRPEIVLKHGPPKRIEDGHDYPCRIISPQCPPSWWHPKLILEFVEFVLKTCSVDEDRLYLTGLSMGGMGTWNTGAARPDLFAALAPICGKTEVSNAEKLKNTWIWAFHGDADKVVTPDGTTGIVNAIQALGGQRVQMTLYEGVGHNSWQRAYDDPALFEWLLSKKRDPKEPAPAE